MLLWRIDAEYDGDADAGGWSQLVQHERFARDLAAQREAFGWLTDVYYEDVGGLAPQTIARLCGPLWPVLPLPQLIEMARNPVRQAKEQLDAIVAKRNGKRERLTWEGK